MVRTKFYNFRRLWEITPEPSRLELSFLHPTLLPNALYILTKFHENSSKGIEVMGRTRFCLQMNYPPMLTKTSYCHQDSLYTRQIQCFGSYAIDYSQTAKTDLEMDKLILNSISNLDLFAIRFSHNLSLYVFPVLDNQSLCNRCIFHRLEQYSCLCISYNSTVLNKICQFQCRMILIAPL